MHIDANCLSQLVANSGRLCADCGSLSHKTGHCATKCHIISIDKESKDVSARLFTSVDDWLNGECMQLQGQ